MYLESWRPPVAIAHRGSRLLWPENTMAAFSGAVSLGFRHLETDIRLSRDGVLVCIHDSKVDRTTDGTGPVAGLDYESLSALDAGSRHVGADGRRFRGEGIRVPSLEEVFLTFPDACFVLDLKAEGVVGPLTDLIRDTQMQGRLIVGSFSDALLDEFRAATAGRIPTSAGATVSRAWVVATRLRGAPRGHASVLQLPRTSRGVRVVDRRLVGAAHSRGLQVHVWTVNDPAEMHELLDLGVDGLITDRPDLLKTALEERDQWG